MHAFTYMLSSNTGSGIVFNMAHYDKNGELSVCPFMFNLIHVKEQSRVT
jgi:hypothetical protein